MSQRSNTEIIPLLVVYFPEFLRIQIMKVRFFRIMWDILRSCHKRPSGLELIGSSDAIGGGVFSQKDLTVYIRELFDGLTFFEFLNNIGYHWTL